MHNPLIIRGLSKFAIFYTLFAINYCFRFVTFWYKKSNKTKLCRHKKETPPRRKPPKTTYIRLVSIFATIHCIPHQNGCFRLFRPFLFNNNIPPARRVFSYSRTLAAPAIFAPFPAIWRHFSPRPVLALVQKFNAIKVVTCCNSRISSISLRVVWLSVFWGSSKFGAFPCEIG